MPINLIFENPVTILYMYSGSNIEIVHMYVKMHVHLVLVVQVTGVKC